MNYIAILFLLASRICFMLAFTSRTIVLCEGEGILRLPRLCKIVKLVRLISTVSSLSPVDMRWAVISRLWMFL